MVSFENLFNNPNIVEVARLGNVVVLERQQDLSVSHSEAMSEYYASKMNCRKR